VKIFLFALLGIAVGAVSYHIPRAVEDYSRRGTPPEWTGPRYRHWKNGVEQK
jgi:hypothetical protein